MPFKISKGTTKERQINIGQIVGNFIIIHCRVGPDNRILWKKYEFCQKIFNYNTIRVSQYVCMSI